MVDRAHMEGLVETRAINRGLLASLGALGTAVLASLCCIGPILFVTLGVGAGLASRFEPLRPMFATLSVILLAVGFYTVYGRKRPMAVECGPDGECVTPRNARRDKVVLWSATFIVVALLTFPEWSVFVL